MISVIIPIYNAAPYLPGCLASLRAQTLQDFEIILVDDGSTDGSGALCDAAAQAQPERVRVLHQANAGVSAARNAGMAAAVGEYLFFVDADDALEPQALAMMAACAARTQADIVIGGMQVVAGDAPVGALYRRLPPDTLLSARTHPALLLECSSVCGVLLRTDFMAKAGLRFAPLRIAEDLQLIAGLLMRAQRAVYLDTPLYRYYQRPGSALHGDDPDKYRDALRAFELLLQDSRDAGLYDRFRDELAFLTLRHLVLDTSVRVLRLDRKHTLPAQIHDFAARHRIRSRGNPYRGRFNRRERVILAILQAKGYNMVHCILAALAALRARRRRLHSQPWPPRGQ